MKNIVCFALVILASRTIDAQPAASSKIAKYYSFKNKAELNIIDSAYKSALDNYKQAFTFKYPNGRDLYNAFITAYLINDTATAKAFFDRMVMDGQTKHHFEENIFIKSILNDTEYRWVTNSYDSLHTASLENNKKILAGYYNTMLYTNLPYYKSREMPDSSKVEDVLTYSQTITDALDIIDIYGFPSYERVGSYERVMKGSVVLPSTFWLMMWYNRGSNPELNAVAQKAVMEGDFPPEEYAILADVQSKGILYAQLQSYKKDSTGHDQSQSNLKESEINKIRAAIYLEPLSDLRKKIEHERKDKRFYFIRTITAIPKYVSTYKLSFD